MKPITLTGDGMIAKFRFKEGVGVA